MWDEYFNSFHREAKKRPDMKSWSIDQLADAAAEAKKNNDKNLVNITISWLMIRFRYQANNMLAKVATTNYDPDQIPGRLFDCIWMAIERAEWQKNPELNAQQCINQVIGTRGAPAIIYEANLKKNNGKALEASLDQEIGDDENGTTVGDMIEDETAKVDYNFAYDVVKRCIKDNKLIEGIIADIIAHSRVDVFKHEVVKKEAVDENGEKYKYTEYSSEFWPRKVVQVLNTLDTEYTEYFTKTYGLTKERFQIAFNALMKTPNAKKYRMLDATTQYLKKVMA